MCLALLALIAQLWLTQISTGHLARMLSERAAWSDICTAVDVPHAGDDAPGTAHSSPATAAFSCPVCAVAAASFATTHQPPSAQPLPVWTLQRSHVATAPAPDAHRAGLRPPAQAPPAA